MRQDGNISQRIQRFFDLYLILFVLAGITATVYLAMTNHRVAESLINKPVLASAFITLATALLFCLKGEKRANIALSHFLIVISLFIVNALLEIPFFADFNSAKSVAWRKGVKWDERNRYEVINEYEKQGIAAYPSGSFSAFVSERGFFSKKYSLNFEDQVFPLSGVSHARTVFCNETGKWMSYISDRYGFNNDDRIYEDTHNSIVLVGDSFTRGECVEPGEDVAGNLRHRGYKAISLGTGGNGPLIELATIKEYAAHLTPKVILWMFFEGNLSQRLGNEFMYPALSPYLNDGYTQDLIHHQGDVDQFWIHFFNMVKKDLAQESKLRAFWDKDRRDEINGMVRRIISLHNVRKRLGLSRSSYMFNKGIDSKKYTDDEEMFRTVMKKALAEAKKLNSELIFVYLPSYGSIHNEKYHLAPESQIVQKVVKELNIPFLDFYSYLKGVKDPARYFPFRTGGHYNPEGYNLLADFIEKNALKKHDDLGQFNPEKKGNVAVQNKTEKGLSDEGV